MEYDVSDILSPAGSNYQAIVANSSISVPGKRHEYDNWYYFYFAASPFTNFLNNSFDIADMNTMKLMQTLQNVTRPARCFLLYAMESYAI